MRLSVDDDGCDLLIQEYEDGGEDGRDAGDRDQPPLGEEIKRIYKPSPVRTCGLQQDTKQCRGSATTYGKGVSVRIEFSWG